RGVCQFRYASPRTKRLGRFHQNGYTRTKLGRLSSCTLDYADTNVCSSMEWSSRSQHDFGLWWHSLANGYVKTIPIRKNTIQIRQNFMGRSGSIYRKLSSLLYEPCNNSGSYYA